jgi:hypothetical protein
MLNAPSPDASPYEAVELGVTECVAALAPQHERTLVGLENDRFTFAL